MLGCLALFSCLMLSCQQQDSAETSQPQPQEYSIAQLLDEQTLREHVTLGSVEGLTRSVEEGEIGVRYEWPLNSPEFIEETNKERARLSLMNGQAPELIPSSARISLNKRSCNMNLVQLQQRLNQETTQESNSSTSDQPIALRVASSSGLWCPKGRVLHFDTPSGPLSLGVELGRGASLDHELALSLARAILTRSEAGFFANNQAPNPAEESWISVE